MNNFAISSSGIGEALQRSASALASAGNTIEESIGLVTAMNSVVQDPDSVGTAVKTLTMYLRAAKTEAEAAGLETDGMASSVSSLRNEIQKLTGVDIMLNDDTFKSTYQILKEIADVWDDLSDVSQSNVLNLLGGKNRANIISSLITNFEDAENAMQSALNSSGSAIKENEKFLDSIKGKINELTVSLEELSSAFISDSLIGGVIDSLRIVVDVLGGVVKMLGTLPTVIAAATLAMNAFGHSLSLLGNQRTSELVSAILNSKGSFSSTMSNLVKGLAGTFGNSAKSFWGELKTFPKTLFSHITEDRGALIAFNKEVQKGGNWLSAFKKHMLGASNEAQGMAIQIGRGEASFTRVPTRSRLR